MDFPAEASEILSKLKLVKDIDVSTERLLQAVLDLSQIRWGRTESICKLGGALYYNLVTHI